MAALQVSCASKADLEVLQAALVTKADKAQLDQVSGGSSSALEALEKSLAGMTAAQASLQAALDSKAAADAVAVLESQIRTKADQKDMESVKADGTSTTALCTNLRQALDAVQSQLTSAQESAASKEALAALEATVDTKADKSTGSHCGHSVRGQCKRADGCPADTG